MGQERQAKKIILPEVLAYRQGGWPFLMGQEGRGRKFDKPKPLGVRFGTEPQFLTCSANVKFS